MSDPLSAPPTTSAAPDFYVVGIGGSAGALEAFSELLRHLPPKPDIAIVVVQHIAAEHESLLVELLSRTTTLPVAWAKSGDVVAPGHVYVAPSTGALKIEGGVLRVLAAKRDMPASNIDVFLLSLAQDCQHRAVGVILSGNGADGSHGVKAIKAGDGITFAQDERSTAYPAMPHAAVQTGAIDRVLGPAAIGEELGKLSQHSHAAWRDLGPAAETGPADETMRAVFRLLTVRTGVDFAEYKQTTIKRRLLRRMVLTKTDRLADYVQLLQKNRDEIDALYESLLINVTEFFRDPELFEFVAEQILPPIFERHGDNDPVRVWVAGCATGEEVYSYAILMREIMERMGRIIPVQIFGTDVSEKAVALARLGFYPTTDVATVSADRLRRFFYQTDRGYVVQKPIRDMCIFARQNVVKDSPFSRLDVISCRNLMIYLGPTLQRKLTPLFHYALAPEGTLILGNSESVGGYSDLFKLIDRRFRIYQRKWSSRRVSLEFSLGSPDLGPLHAASKPPLVMSNEPTEPHDIIREADRIVLTRHGPSGVLVNDELDILQFRGDVSQYLTPLPGRASLNLLKMAREGLATELQNIVREARAAQARTVKRGVAVMVGLEARRIDLDVTPIIMRGEKDACYLILFVPPEIAPPKSEKSPPIVVPEGAKKPAYLAQIEQLTHDLQATRSYLQTTIERHESTNQELRAANEEIQSSNEELQSTNEELETAKEELQSTNEELTTVNEELHSRQLELLQANNDLNNLINSVHLPIIILDQDLRIRRFTPMAEKVLNVIPTDVGRPLSDINIKLKIPDLPRMIAEVIDTLLIREIDVQDEAGLWHSLRIRPYKTADKKIEGVVLTLIDVDDMRRTIAELEQARNVAQAVVETAPEPIAALNERFQVRIANHAFYALFFSTPEEMQGHPFLDFVKDAAEAKAVKHALEQVLPKKKLLTDLKLQLDQPGGGRKELSLHARQIIGANRSYPLILLSVRPHEGKNG